MAEFVLEYGLFFAKTVTIVLAIIIVIATIASKKQTQSKESIEIKNLNQKFDAISALLNASILSKQDFKKFKKEEKSKKKGDRENKAKKRIFVLNFNGDIRATAVSALREEVSAILTVANETDEIFLRLESGGGVVNAYGLAASQLMRIRERNIPLTISVDKVAASGGYMMACVANCIIAAPFAIIGSIGVLAQIPNFHKVLKKHDIEFEQFTAGEYKRTVTLFGENTDDARIKFKQEVEDIHLLFKDFIVKNRPDVDILKVSTGEHWPGLRAIEHKLVDELKTSDDYLLERSQQADIYELSYKTKKSIFEKVGFQISKSLARFPF